MCAHAGFLLGSRETLLETKDGGRTWEPRSVAAAKDEGDSVLRIFPSGSCMPLLENCQAGRMAERHGWGTDFCNSNGNACVALQSIAFR